MAAATIAAQLFSACGGQNPAVPSRPPDGTSAQQASGNADNDSSASEPKIQITYSHKNDFLTSLIVTEYSGAQELRTFPTDSGKASIIRFDGGFVVWQIDRQKGMFSAMSDSDYAVGRIRYGMVPNHFAQSVPDQGSPPPLEPGHFYVFSVLRWSGADNFEVVKVEPDGTLQSYEAEPRAGTSFELCCDVTRDFTVVPQPDLAPPS